MKKKTAGAAAVVIAVANADVVTAADTRDLKRKDSKSGKQSKSHIPDPQDLRYGALCVDKEDGDKVGSKSMKSSKSAKKGKSKGKPLYYDGEDNCVPAKELDATKCADHKVVVYEEGCAVVDGDTDGCKTKEMCAQRHQSGETCSNCADPDKIHACVGCPNREKKRGLMADAW